jgi:hypothetical protein
MNAYINLAAWPAITEAERADLQRIACTECPTVETLEIQHRDRLDFHDIGVASLREALALAYLMGARRWAPGARVIKPPRRRRAA